MFGAMIGDVVGSKYEFDNIKTKEFPLFSPGCSFTDDSVMTAAVAKAILLSLEVQFGRKKRSFSDILVQQMQEFGAEYPYPQGGYGGNFALWLRDPHPKPYNSFGNGSAMRVSPCAIIAVDLGEALALARLSAKVTHNHPEGVKGAEATAAAIFLARTGYSKADIRNFIQTHYYDLNQSLEDIRRTYYFNESCQGTVPQAIIAFLESDSFEDAIRNAISIGGDSDTLGAITGSIAWAYYRSRVRSFSSDSPNIQATDAIRQKASAYIPSQFLALAEELEKTSCKRAGAYHRTGFCSGIMSEHERNEAYKHCPMPEKADP